MSTIHPRPLWASDTKLVRLLAGAWLACFALGGTAIANATQTSHGTADSLSFATTILRSCKSYNPGHCGHAEAHLSRLQQATRRAPATAVSGSTISWKSISGVRTYVLATKDPGKSYQYSVVKNTRITPAVLPGQTVAYWVRTEAAGSAWSPTISITYPTTTFASGSPTTSAPADAATPAQTPTSDFATVNASDPDPAPLPTPPLSTPAPTSTGRIIGTNDGSGWGTSAAKTILAGHITWDRVEVGSPYESIATSEQDGFHTLAVVGNVANSTPLSQVEPSDWATTVVSQLQENPGISIAEAGNEMYLKGDIADPVRYGRMYMAALTAMKGAGLHTRLLFNMLGDYPRGSWTSSRTWSMDSEGGGWLRDAVTSVPGLASAILANGLSTHPYGALDENNDDTQGVEAVTAQESIAQAVLGTTPSIYITEFGYSLSNCGESNGACSESEQASKMRAAYAAFLADPHVAGIWCYQAHDDSTGDFGYMNDNNTTRPSFQTLSSIAVEQGQ